MSGTVRMVESRWPARGPRTRISAGKAQLRQVIDPAVAAVFEVDVDDLRASTRRSTRTAFARQVAMYLAHVVCGMTLTDTGRLFGRDRTTVAHACGVIEDRRDDPLFDRALDLLEWVVPAIATRFPSTPHLSS